MYAVERNGSRSPAYQIVAIYQTAVFDMEFYLIVRYTSKYKCQSRRRSNHYPNFQQMIKKSTVGFEDFVCKKEKDSVECDSEVFQEIDNERTEAHPLRDSEISHNRD